MGNTPNRACLELVRKKDMGCTQSGHYEDYVYAEHSGKLRAHLGDNALQSGRRRVPAQAGPGPL